MKMAFDPEATLSDVLAGGYHLSAKLEALLGRPLDNRGQQEAMAFSQELSRVFMLSISMVKANDTRRTLKTMAPDIRTADSFGFCTLAKDKVISRGAVISHKNVKGDEFTRKEVTSEPHKDGYQWQKYGQKNIQNCSFMRHYFKCHDRRCNARKKVQRQDGSSDDAPVFEVTYMNEHTCHRHVDVPGNSRSLPPPPTTGQQPSIKAAAAEKASGNGGGAAIVSDGFLEENAAIVSCLATVISSTAPADGKQTPRVGDDGAMLIDAGFWWDDEEDPAPSSSFWSTDPAELVTMTDLQRDDVHMGAARFVGGTVWQQY